MVRGTASSGAATPGAARSTAPSSGRLALAGCLAVIAVFWVDKFARPDGRGFLTGDLFVYYYPTYLRLGEILRGGASPLWDPFSLCGIPGLASLQRGYLYPPHALFALLPTSWAMALLAWAHLALAAGGSFLFARRIGLGVAGAAVAALVLGTGHHVPALSFFPNQMAAAAWFPLGCALCVPLAERPGARAVAGLAAVWAMSLLAGYPQASLYTAYGWTAVLAILLAARRRSAASWLRAIGALAAAGLLGSLLAAIQLVPALELIGRGPRTGGALPLVRMFPFGVPDGFAEAYAREVIHRGGTHLFLGFGLVASCLVPAALLARGRRGLAVGLLLLGAGFALLALGPATPAFDLLRRLPGLSAFRLPNRGLFVTSFAFAAVAAIGFEAVRGWRVASADGAFGRRGAILALPVLVAVVVEPLLAAPSGLGLPYLGEDVRVFREARRLRGVLDDDSARLLIPDAFPDPLVPAAAASVQGLRSLSGYEPLNTRRQALYFDFLERGRLGRSPDEDPFHGFVTRPAGWIERRRLLDLAAVAVIALPEPESQRYGRGLARAGFERGERIRLGEGWVRAWRNPAALPRAYVSRRALPAPDPATLLERISAPDYDPRAGVYLEGGGRPETGAATAAAAAATVRFARDSATAIELEVELAAPGVLVLADTHYPGWRARVDGVPVPVRPANLLFRGVELTAGRHRVVFEYRPRSLWVGASLSAVGAAAVAALVWRGRRPAA